MTRLHCILCTSLLAGLLGGLLALTPQVVFAQQRPAVVPLLEKTASPVEVLPGGEFTFTVTVRNVLLSTIRDATVTDRIDGATNLELVSSAEADVLEDGALQWTIETLPPGETWSRQYVIRLPADAVAGTVIRSITGVSGEGLDQVPLNEKVGTAAVTVIGRLPDAGVPYDLLLSSVFVPLAAAGALWQRTMRR